MGEDKNPFFIPLFVNYLPLSLCLTALIIFTMPACWRAAATCIICNVTLKLTKLHYYTPFKSSRNDHQKVNLFRRHHGPLFLSFLWFCFIILATYFTKNIIHYTKSKQKLRELFDFSENYQKVSLCLFLQQKNHVRSLNFSWTMWPTACVCMPRRDRISPTTHSTAKGRP